MTLHGALIFGLITTIGFLRKNPQQKAQLEQSLLAGKEWLASAVSQLKR